LVYRVITSWEVFLNYVPARRSRWSHRVCVTT